MKNSLYQQLFMPSPFNSGGNSTIHNQIRSHVVAVLNAKGTTKTFERPHSHVDVKGKQTKKYEIQRNFEEVNEAFRRVHQIKHGCLDNKEPKTFSMRISKHPCKSKNTELIEHANNIQSLYNKISSFKFIFKLFNKNQLELEKTSKNSFRQIANSNKHLKTKLPSSGVLTAHNQKSIFLNPRQQYFNFPKSSWRPLSAQFWRPKQSKIIKQQNEVLQCMDFFEASNLKLEKEEQAFLYPKISLTPEQLIEKQIRILRVQSKQFNDFIEKFDWRQIIELLLQIEREEIIGQEEFSLQLKECVVHLVVMFEAKTRQNYNSLQQLAEIVFPKQKSLVNEIFSGLETYLLK